MKKLLSIITVCFILIGCEGAYPKEWKNVEIIYSGNDTITITNGHPDYSKISNYLRHGWNDTINNVYYHEVFLYSDSFSLEKR